MKNPCDVCIVKACCTQLCEAKENYREHLNIILDGLKPHTFSKNGHQRKKIPQNIYIHWEKKIRLQKINHQEISIIAERVFFLTTVIRT